MIRFASQHDCESLAALSIQVWLETYASDGITHEHASYVLRHFAPQQFMQSLNCDQSKIVVIEENAMVVGYALVQLDSYFGLQKHGFEIVRLYIHKAYQGKGYGRALLQYISSEIGNRFWLYTWVKNRSNAFYEHCGFKKLGTHTFYFGDNEIENNVYAHRESIAD